MGSANRYTVALVACGLFGVGMAELGLVGHPPDKPPRLVSIPVDMAARQPFACSVENVGKGFGGSDSHTFICTKTGWVQIWENPKIYPYSVVPGGVDSLEDMIAARKDKLVDQHYDDLTYFGRMQGISESLYLYASYRKGGRIYWTSHRIKIPSGSDLLIVAGSRPGLNFIRQRCGNLLSDLPMQPTLPEAQERPVLEAMGQAEEKPKAEMPDLGVPNYVETVRTPIMARISSRDFGSPDHGVRIVPVVRPLLGFLGAYGGLAFGPRLSGGAAGELEREAGGGVIAAPEPKTYGYMILASAVFVCWKVTRKKENK